MAVRPIEAIQRIKQQDAAIRAYVKQVAKLEAELASLRILLAQSMSSAVTVSIAHKISAEPQTLSRGIK